LAVWPIVAESIAVPNVERKSLVKPDMRGEAAAHHFGMAGMAVALGKFERSADRVPNGEAQ
jgi:hypothetical protein